jgi:hypothetical protein
MRKNISKLLGLVLIISIVVGISYISLLGENDRAATTAKMYFDNIANKRYEANTQLCNDAYNRHFDNINDPITHQFSLETALLNHFGLINTAQYTTETRRDEFWIPHSSKATLHVSVRINVQRSGNILTNFMNPSTSRYLVNLVTLVREDGRWKISDIDIRSSAIAGDYQSIKHSMQNSKYIQQTANDLTIKENTFEFATLDPIQKRIINFNLNKALTLLNAHK